VHDSRFGIICLLTLLMVGCAGPPRRNTTGVPDWEEQSPHSTVVSPGPALAAPASEKPIPLGSFHNPGSTEAVSRPITNRVSESNNLPGSPGAPANFRSSASWVSLQSWCNSCPGVELSHVASGSPAGFVLRSDRGTFVLHVGSLVAQWNGIDVRLGFGPQLINDQPFIHGLDLEKTILPLLISAPAAGTGQFKGPIVLDAGHGGEDAGARSVGAGYNEKDLTLDWALRLKNSLAAKGYPVLLTRSNDATVALSDRVAVAARAGASVFISLHFNSSAPKETERGLETYCLTPAGQPSTLTRGYPDDLSQSFANNAFDVQNLQLAVEVHRALLAANGHHNRGVRRARFPTVLRGQECPAILIEGGYLSNPQEVKAIGQPDYRQGLAEAVADGLEDWLQAQAR
jgi:N-acetylmuramoyl-L-alanine amidase